MENHKRFDDILMSQSVIQRVDMDKLAIAGNASKSTSGKGGQQEFSPQMVRWFVIPLSVILCIVLAMFTIVASNTLNFIMTSTLMAVGVMGVVFTLAVIVNPLLRLTYGGRWLGESQMSRMELIQSWAGKLTLGAFLGAAVVKGPGVMIWAYWIIMGVIGAVVLIDIALGFSPSRGGRTLTSLGKNAIGWGVTFAASLAVMYVLALSTSSAVALLVVAGLIAAVYCVLWVLSTRSFTRAELMTVLAALVVASGISTFGLTEQLVPLVTTPYNPEWNTPQARWDKELHPNLKTELFITDPIAIRQYREGEVRTPDGKRLVAPSEIETGLASWKNWGLYYVQVAQNLPWKLWITPLTYWLIFVLGCYALFYSLTYTVVDFWANREKLIFPLAQLRESLLPDDAPGRFMPAVCRSPGFWAALIVTAGVLSYNACSRFGWLGDMSPISQGMNNFMFTDTVRGTFLEGISGGAGGMRFAMYFTAIGIAFLLPLEISFSIWFYYIASRVLILILVGAGYGRNMSDFPSDWLYRQNEITAQGMGALLVFAIYMLYRALKDNGIQMTSKVRSVKARWFSALPVIGLTASITVVTMWIWWMWQWNISYLFWAFVFVIFLTLLTVGLMRITAEGGIYWFQNHASFFHLWKVFALGKFLPGTLLGPLLPVYSVLFLDIKTFMAPSMIDGAKMHKDVGGSRAIYHLNMVITLLVAIFTSIGFALVMSYARGAQRMNSWFYSSGPKSMMNTAQQASSSVPEFNGYSAGWVAGGGIWVIISVLARRSIFWFPHPVGYVMLINPMINTLWFSFFIGWICKKLVVKYGGKTTFDKTRNIFIGLILGEVLAICGWGIATFFNGQTNQFLSLNNTF